MTEYITLALAGIAAVLSLVCVLIRPKQGATLRDLQNLSQELQDVIVCIDEFQQLANLPDWKRLVSSVD